MPSTSLSILFGRKSWESLVHRRGLGEHELIHLPLRQHRLSRSTAIALESPLGFKVKISGPSPRVREAIAAFGHSWCVVRKDQQLFSQTWYVISVRGGETTSLREAQECRGHARKHQKYRPDPSAYKEIHRSYPSPFSLCLKRLDAQSRGSAIFRISRFP